MLARALWLEHPGTAVIKSEPIDGPMDGEVLIRNRFGAISRGTERLVLEGNVPGSEEGRMRGPHQCGEFSFPVKYGYAGVGTIEAGSERIGQTVFCLYPHQDRFVVTASEAITVPQGVPPERAVLAANMETALNVVWDASIQPGDRVNVFGAGLVGCLIAYLAARIPATTVLLCDPDAAKSSIADALGVRFASPDAALADVDIAINASGTTNGLRAALASAGFEARVVEASWHGSQDVSLPLGEAFHSRRLRLVSSQVAVAPAERRARWPNSRRIETALGLLVDDRLDVLISGETAFEGLPDAYADILAALGTLCHRIRY